MSRVLYNKDVYELQVTLGTVLDLFQNIKSKIAVKPLQWYIQFKEEGPRDQAHQMIKLFKLHLDNSILHLTEADRIIIKIHRWDCLFMNYSKRLVLIGKVQSIIKSNDTWTEILKSYGEYQLKNELNIISNQLWISQKHMQQQVDNYYKEEEKEWDVKKNSIKSNNNNNNKKRKYNSPPPSQHSSEEEEDEADEFKFRYKDEKHLKDIIQVKKEKKE